MEEKEYKFFEEHQTNSNAGGNGNGHGYGHNGGGPGNHNGGGYGNDDPNPVPIDGISPYLIITVFALAIYFRKRIATFLIS